MYIHLYILYDTHVHCMYNTYVYNYIFICTCTCTYVLTHDYSTARMQGRTCTCTYVRTCIRQCVFHTHLHAEANELRHCMRQIHIYTQVRIGLYKEANVVCLILYLAPEQYRSVLYVYMYVSCNTYVHVQ